MTVLEQETKTLPVMGPFMTEEEFTESLRAKKTPWFLRREAEGIRSFSKAFHICRFGCSDGKKRTRRLGLITDTLSGATAMLPEGDVVKIENYEECRLGTVFAPKFSLEEVVELNRGLLERSLLKKWGGIPRIDIIDHIECYRVYYLVSYVRSKKMSVYPADNYRYF